MRLIKIVLLILIVSYFKNIAQEVNTVNYSLFLEKSVSFGTVDTKIHEGSFNEGESFIIPAAFLPASPIDFSIYQDLYNALVGGRFSIDYGALNNDIIMKIFIRKLNKTAGEYLNLGEYNDTLFAYFEIRIWELPDSNFFPEETSFYFNEGYFARFSLPKSEALLNFLNLVEINVQDPLAFAFLENDSDNNENWNGYGIETVDDQDSVKFKAIHLSRIGGGRKNLASNIIKSDSLLGVNINKLKEIPNIIELEQNYPNPFNPSTKIKYSIVDNGNVKLDIYNILGKQILNLVDQHQSAGTYEIEFSTSNLAKDLSSGIYIYTLRNNNKIFSKRMILMK